jgi:chaperone modulatory protein CbpM
MTAGSTVVIVCETVEVVEEQIELSLVELCRSVGAEPALVAELVAHGLLEPAGPDPDRWRFSGASLALTRRAQRLIDDLGVNAAGAVVAIELLGRIEQLERNQRR